MDQTIDYYNKNAASFVQGTVDVDFSDNQDLFLSLLKEGDHILDFGCGSGRDTKYFLDKHMQVTAVDGSAELCRLASAYTGISVRQMMFQDLCDTEIYDGIWACSSILHLPKSELHDVFIKMRMALKKSGYIYTSFKYGSYEGMRNGRYFSDFTEESFRDLIKDLEDMQIKKIWITGDVRANRGNEQWLNLIMQKI